MTTTITVVGDRWVTMNGSHHNHYAHQQHMREWQNRAILQIRQQRIQPFQPYPVVMTALVHRTTNAKSDAHNVLPTIKACIDGIVICGVLPDDNDDIISRLVIERGPQRPDPAVTLILEAAS